MVCFLPLGSIKRHVNSSTEAETICSLIWVRGNVASKVRISSFNTFKQAILLLNGNEFRLETLHYSLYFSLASSYTKQALFRDKVCLIMKIFFLWIVKERESSFVVNLVLDRIEDEPVISETKLSIKSIYSIQNVNKTS